MNRRSMSSVQRLVLSIAVPLVAFLLTREIKWVGRLDFSMNGKPDSVSYFVHLQEQTMFWPVFVAGVAAWLYWLWPARDARQMPADGNGMDGASVSAVGDDAAAARGELAATGPDAGAGAATESVR